MQMDWITTTKSICHKLNESVRHEIKSEKDKKEFKLLLLFGYGKMAKEWQGASTL